MLKADFHIHTNKSKCSDMSPTTVLERARDAGLDVIGVVDHNCIEGGLEAQKLSGGNPLVLPGEEIMTEWGELLIFPSDGEYRGTAREICERAKQNGALVIVPHPFDSSRNALGERIREVRDFVGAVETPNARCIFGAFNRKAAKLADELNLPKIAGSDAHFAKEIGGVANFLDCEKTVSSVVDCVRKGGFRTVQNGTFPAKRHVQTFFHRIRNRLSKL